MEQQNGVTRAYIDKDKTKEPSPKIFRYQKDKWQKTLLCLSNFVKDTRRQKMASSIVIQSPI